MKPYKVKVPIYYGRLTVIYSKNLKKGARKVGVDLKDVKHCLGLAMRIGGKDSASYLILVKSKKDNNTIAHEALHVANYIFYDKGIAIDTENDEAQAYLLSWVVSQCEKAKKHK